MKAKAQVDGRAALVLSRVDDERPFLFIDPERHTFYLFIEWLLTLLTC